jgi:isoleucyl-tRNA synthetase
LKYNEYSHLDLVAIQNDILKFWEDEDIFGKSLEIRSEAEPFTFFEGPPSANGMPGIHHVMARAIKDIFCRYKTQKGFRVARKGGWDTHGLPIELSVEKTLGITKEDIGKKISVDEYNAACKKEVMKFKSKWDELTRKMGYWLDLDDPYITYETPYIESLWSLLKKLYDKNFLYKGYTIQPFSPAAGTGLSSHELNQPGAYRDVKDTSVTAQFEVVRNKKSEFLFEGDEYVGFIAWTTTPWTLPSNCALAVGEKIEYVKVKTFNPYTFAPVNVILANELVGKYFNKKAKDIALEDYNSGDKLIPFKIGASFTGKDLLGISYHQLLPYVQPEKLAFIVIPADFVTTEDGTGIVHTASVFGADDYRVCKENDIPSILVVDEEGNESPLVNRQGKFVDEVTDFAGMYVRAEYYSDEIQAGEGFQSADVKIAIKLKEDNKAFKVEKYEHSYPHCWRTDKPILYYPLDSWFIKTTAVKDRMVELNKTINWKPESTGTGRFGNWLENLVDWNLSRSRFWGTPLPIWRTEDGKEEVCIGSIEELKSLAYASAEAGNMAKSAVDAYFDGEVDLHRPYVDDLILTSSTGTKMLREPDLIDVWFDSGAMPYAQWHYPFENEDKFKENYPADFIAEGVDQTRGWFFTLHAIAVMLFDSVAYKNVVSNGLVLDKAGNKMSKRLGNAADPFETIDTESADATRWYMISNASPWDNLKFNAEGIGEVRRKFFGTFYNTYNFFALYANIDGFNGTEPQIEHSKRPEIDRWVLSMLNSLVKDVDSFYADYEPTKAARAIQSFVNDHLSNWYVRLSRRRFWKGDYSQDKISAYQTLYKCLITVTKLSAPISPFFFDRMFKDLNAVTGDENAESVHLADFPISTEAKIDLDLEERMTLAQDITSMVLSLRKKSDLRVRQPLRKILIPCLQAGLKDKIEAVADLILSEVNVKEFEFITDTAGVLVKKIKPDFKLLGPKFGKNMKAVAAAVNAFGQDQINEIEAKGEITIDLNGAPAIISVSDVEISSEDIPGWLVASEGRLTVALDITLDDDLISEGIAREFVNRVQNLRKDKGFEITDKIKVELESHPKTKTSISQNLDYICAEILAQSLIEFPGDKDFSDLIEIEGEQIRLNILKS